MIDPATPPGRYAAPVSRRALITIAAAALLALGAVLLRLLVGGPSLAWPDSDTVLELRATRALAGALVGAALALAGVKLQCLLRNPLASPDLLGLASGAGLGVMVAAYLAAQSGGSLDPGPSSGIAALVGSLLVLSLVYFLSQKRGLIDPVSLILVGVVLSIMCSAASMFIEHLLPDRGNTARRWMLGAIRDDLSLSQLQTFATILALWLAVALAMSRAMDAASLGEDEARSLGLRLGWLRAALFIASGVLCAGAVTLAGPIGFVGLICPHLVRLAAGPAHRPLIIAAVFAGAALVVGADTAVKALDLGAGRLPIGVMTSLIGGPLFILLLRGSVPREA
jgi:iron complex transport system permease protein